jgi:hypothetical protein
VFRKGEGSFEKAMRKFLQIEFNSADIRKRGRPRH